MSFLIRLIPVILVSFSSLWGQLPPLSDLRARVDAGEGEAVLAELEATMAKEKLPLDHVLLMTDVALRAGELRKARHLADYAQATWPEEPRAHTWYAHALFAEADAALASGSTGPFVMANLVDAATFYRRARELGGDAYLNAFCEADALEKARRPEAALEALAFADQARPNEVNVIAFKMRLLLALGRAQEVIDLVPDGVPEPVETARLFLNAHLSVSTRERARDVFLRLVARYPSDRGLYESFFRRFSVVHSRTSEGANEYLEDVGLRSEAFLRETFARVLAENPGDRLAHWYGAYVNQIERRLEDALTGFVVYRDMSPSDGGGWFHVAQVLRLLGRLDDARDAILEATAKGGVEDELLSAEISQLVAKFHEQRQYEKAMELQQVALSRSHDPLLQRNLATLQFAAGRREDAIRTFERLLGRDDLDPGVRGSVENDLGLALSGLGQKPLAEAAFRRALEDNPALADARENLGVLLAELGRLAEARGELEIVVAADPLRHRARYHLLKIIYPDLLLHR